MKCHDPDCTKDHAPRTRALTPADHFVFDESASVLKLCYGGGAAPRGPSARLDALEARLADAERRVAALEAAALRGAGDESAGDPAVARVRAAARPLLSARFTWVPEDYYERPLAWRAARLGCGGVAPMCKSMLLENKAWAPDGALAGAAAADGDDSAAALGAACADRTNSRFYLVVVQYAAAFSAEKLRGVVQALRPDGPRRLAKRRLNFQVAPEAACAALTGFAHGAVSPLGLLHAVPVVLASAAADVRPAFLWMGGGHPRLKLGVALAELRAAVDPIVADVSDARAAGEAAE